MRALSVWPASNASMRRDGQAGGEPAIQKVLGRSMSWAEAAAGVVNALKFQIARRMHAQ